MKELFKIMVQDFCGESVDVSNSWNYNQESYKEAKEIVKFVLEELEERDSEHNKCVFIRKVFKLNTK